MTSVRKRKMARSSIRKTTRRLKDKQRDINIYSNPIIAANWDKSLTLQQNYKKLGLRAKLGSLAGGQEQKVETLTQIRAQRDQEEKEAAKEVKPEDIEHTEDPTQIPEGEARLIRDPETNEVVKVVYGTMKVAPKSNDDDNKTDVIRQLEQRALQHASTKKERTISDRENEWLELLYNKYGDDYEKMKWDKKLNVYQQSAGDLRKRIIKWKKANKIDS